VSLPSSSAAPFALVANEILGNALKHGFPTGRDGHIGVSLTDQGDNCLLTIADDGVGLTGPPAGFGSTIVRLLCRQLHADLAIDGSSGGTKVTLKIPLGQASGQP
jgi:two-component sensor histidine kinase